MAKVVAQWIRDDVAPTLDTFGMSLRGVETLESFGCRSFNGISGAKLSEHGRANALDVRSLKVANGTVVELTNATVSKSLREQLRQTACTRFSTVLGNGADAYHENHVHIDLMQRTNNYKICQWDILDPAEIAAHAAKKSAVAAMPIPEATPVQRCSACHGHARSLTQRHRIHRQQSVLHSQEGMMRSPATSFGTHPDERTCNARRHGCHPCQHGTLALAAARNRVQPYAMVNIPDYTLTVMNGTEDHMVNAHRGWSAWKARDTAPSRDHEVHNVQSDVECTAVYYPK